MAIFKMYTQQGHTIQHGNSAQCYVAAWFGGEFEGEWTHVHVWLSPFPVHLKLSQYCLLTQSEKAGLKLSIQKTKIMAFGPITSWQIDEETMETVTDFIFLSSKITADGDCSHEIKRRLLLGRKVMTNLDSILKRKLLLCQQRSVLVKAMVFPVFM